MIPKYPFQVVVDQRIASGGNNRRAHAFETLTAAWEYMVRMKANPLTRHVQLLVIVHDEATAHNGNSH
jgi:hypothetical protein